MAYIGHPAFLSHQPFIEIIEQPKKKALRFRYPTESRKAGNIYGESHTDAKPRYPSIRVSNVSGPVTAMMFCVTAQGELHPHKLVGENCIDAGIYVAHVASLSAQDGLISFSNVGVQCCKKDDIAKFLKEKKQLMPDCRIPKNMGAIDLTSVCLMFRVVTQHLVMHAMSRPVIDKKHCCDLTIARVSTLSCPADESCEVFILCNKVKKDDVEVVFSDGSWEGYGTFVPTDVFKECAIVCKVPVYKDRNIEKSVDVELFLREKSSMETGNRILFTYTPVNEDHYGIGRKKRALMNQPMVHQQVVSQLAHQLPYNNFPTLVSEQVAPSCALLQHYFPIQKPFSDPFTEQRTENSIIVKTNTIKDHSNTCEKDSLYDGLRKLPIFCQEADVLSLKKEKEQQFQPNIFNNSADLHSFNSGANFPERPNPPPRQPLSPKTTTSQPPSLLQSLPTQCTFSNDPLTQPSQQPCPPCTFSSEATFSNHLFSDPMVFEPSFSQNLHSLEGLFSEDFSDAGRLTLEDLREFENLEDNNPDDILNIFNSFSPSIFPDNT